jgi:hypothetical protein
MSKKTSGKKHAKVFFIVFFAMVIATGIFAGKVFSESFLKANVVHYSSSDIASASKKPIASYHSMLYADPVPTALPSSTLLPDVVPATLLPPKNIEPESTLEKNNRTLRDSTLSPEKFTCAFTEIAKPVFTGRFISLTKAVNIAPGTISEMQILIAHTENFSRLRRIQDIVFHPHGSKAKTSERQTRHRALPHQ